MEYFGYNVDLLNREIKGKKDQIKLKKVKKEKENIDDQNDCDNSNDEKKDIIQEISNIKDNNQTKEYVTILEDEKCPICRDNFKINDQIKITCMTYNGIMHLCHKDCSVDYFRSSPTCCICRKQMDKNAKRKNYLITKSIEDSKILENDEDITMQSFPGMQSHPAERHRNFLSEYHTLNTIFNIILQPFLDYF